jgi:purine-binding chemotaxis protein CheW
MDPLTTTEASAQYLTFSLMGEEYAVGLLQVREILEYDTVTRIPKAPAWVRGAINLRGRVVPVADLAVRFGLPPIQVSTRSCIVIVDVAPAAGSPVVGILVDSVSQVIAIAPTDIAAAPTFGTKVGKDDLLGVAPLGKKFALILDVERVLSWSDSPTEPAAERSE